MIVHLLLQMNGCKNMRTALFCIVYALPVFQIVDSIVYSVLGPLEADTMLLNGSSEYQSLKDLVINPVASSPDYQYM